MAADEITQESWRIAEELGDPRSESVKLWETVRDELGPKMPFPQMMAVANLMRAWKDTKNPYYVDAAVSICSDCAVTPTPAILDAMATVARLRFDRAPAGTADKVKKEALHDKLLTLMMNLVVAGCELPLAARKAQHWQQKAYGVRHYKASTLQKHYEDRVKNTGFEKFFKDYVGQWEHWHKPTWTKIGDAMPEAPEHESGVRRR